MGRRGESSGAAWLRPRYARPGGPPGALLTRRRLLSFPVLGGLVTVPDFPDEKAPDAHATAISLTGAPLLNLHTQEYFNAGQNLGPGAGLNPAAVSVNQPGYFYRVTAVLVSGSPVGPVTITLTWQDSGSALLTGIRSYTAWPGSAGNPHTIAGYGRNRGNRLFINVTNNSSGATVNVVVVVAATSVPFTLDRGQSVTLTGLASGNTLGQYDLPAGIMGANDLNTLAAGTSRTDDLALYQGKVFLFAQTASLTTDLTLVIQAVASVPVTGQAQRVFEAVSDSHGLVAAELTLPADQCSIFLLNNATVARRVNYQVLAEDL